MRVDGGVAVAREVFEHRQHTGVAQPLGVGAGELDDLRRVRTERAITDHLVIGFFCDVDDRCEVDRDTEPADGLTALERDAANLVRCHRLREHPRGRLAADQVGQA